jgi:hypothetical protein
MRDVWESKSGSQAPIAITPLTPTIGCESLATARIPMTAIDADLCNYLESCDATSIEP